MGQGLHMPAWNALMLVPRHKQDFYWEYFRMHNRQIICMHDNFSTEKFQMNPLLKFGGSSDSLSHQIQSKSSIQWDRKEGRRSSKGCPACRESCHNEPTKEFWWATRTTEPAAREKKLWLVCLLRSQVSEVPDVREKVGLESWLCNSKA